MAGFGPLQGQQSLLGQGDDLAAQAYVRLDVGNIVDLASAVDDEQEVVTTVDEQQVIDDAALFIEQQAVALLVQAQAHHIHGDQGFQGAGRLSAHQSDLAHVRHVKQARCGAGVFVFGHQACGVLHRHVVARKRHHACPQGQMQAMQRGFEQRVVRQSGLQPKAVPAPCQHREPCCPLYLRDSDCLSAALPLRWMPLCTAPLSNRIDCVSPFA